jgi:hypothetical protein
MLRYLRASVVHMVLCSGGGGILSHMQAQKKACFLECGGGRKECFWALSGHGDGPLLYMASIE